MKRTIKCFMVLGVFSFCAALYAEPTVWLSGRFQINPQVMHKNAIAGVMSLMTAEENLALVKLELDKPVMGKTLYESSEQVLQTASEGNAVTQGAVIYKIKGSPHKFYFVLIFTLNIQGTYDGVFYRADTSLDDILSFIRDGIRPSPDWKVVGSVSLSHP